MGIRTGIQKCGRRIGRVLGLLDIYNDVGGVKNDISNFRSHIDDYWNDASPYLKFYYYNEAAKNIHPLVFEKYRNCNKGKKVVIVACGPSVDKYKPIKGAKHIAINRAFLKKDIKFNYIFVHDRMILDDCRTKIKKYKADKFVAYATNFINSYKNNMVSKDVTDIGGKRFIISDPALLDTGGGQFDVIQPDITRGAFYDRGGGTVFSALQFALFTNPKEIYLVGCDCTQTGYFKNKGIKTKQNYLLEKTKFLWEEVKYFVEQYYPDTKIISVNPVGLKGLFTDLKQK